MMPMIHSRETTIRYITERRCESGGYCFYRLDEPNAGDTFYALASLAILGALPRDDETTRTYLHSFQRPDGSFPNVNVGHAVIKSLALLGDQPATDSAEWILASMTLPADTSRPMESTSLFEPLYHLTGLCRLLRITIPAGRKEEIIRALLRYHGPDDGYGQPGSTMIETAHALFIHATVDNETSSQPAIRFLKRCEDPDYGFHSVSGARPPFLEHIHAGVLACSVLGYPSPALGRCEEFIRKCCRENGGYVRSVFGGSATLENTFLALDALTMIHDIKLHSITSGLAPGMEILP
jgi:hypothetical protein